METPVTFHLGKECRHYAYIIGAMLFMAIIFILGKTVFDIEDIIVHHIKA